MDPRDILYNSKKKQLDPLLNQEFKQLLQENKKLKRHAGSEPEPEEQQRLKRILYYFTLYIITCEETIRDYTGLLQEITKKECLNKPFDVYTFWEKITNRFEDSVLVEPETRNNLVTIKRKRLIDNINIIMNKHNKETLNI